MFKIYIYIKSQCLYFISKERLRCGAQCIFNFNSSPKLKKNSLKWNIMFYTPHIYKTILLKLYAESLTPTGVNEPVTSDKHEAPLHCALYKHFNF